MKRNSPVFAIPLAFLLLSSAALAAPNGGTLEKTAVAVTAPAKVAVSETESHPVRDSGIGCATGAALGSVLPGLGNAVGCVVGGLLGWWMS